jgi:hypothetical protein
MIPVQLITSGKIKRNGYICLISRYVSIRFVLVWSIVHLSARAGFKNIGLDDVLKFLRDASREMGIYQSFVFFQLFF